jgi:phosphomannomutase/phosphoglucomutase
MWKTGHSLIKEKMRETGAPIGGELSGHICFADEFIGSDDALYAACRLCAMLSRSPRSLSEMTAQLPTYASTPEIRIEVPEDRKTAIVGRAVEHFRKSHEVVDVDGARILFGDGWGLLRASNTQPVLVARFEAESTARLAEIRAEVEGWLRDQGVHV